MSKEDFERFTERLRTDEKLQAELEGKSEIPELIEMAGSHGYSVTEADVREYFESRSGELSEGGLAAAAGGGKPFAVNTTRFDPYKNFKF